MITNYNECPLGKYLKVCEAMQEQALDEFQKQVAIIAILSDTTEDEVLKLSLTEYRKRSAGLVFLSELIEAGEVAKEYKCGNLTLVPCLDARKMVTAQYIDFQTYAKEGESRLVETLSCLLIPKGKKYGWGYEFEEVQAALREHLPITAAVTLSAFFLTKYAELIAPFLSFWEQKTKPTPKELEKILRKM